MFKRVFVTGGAGYIGSHTCLELLKENCEILVYDNLSNGSLEALKTVQLLANRKLEFVQGDIRDIDFLVGSMKQFQPDIVVHFAGLKVLEESARDPLAYYGVNVTGSLNLLTAMKLSNCYKIVFSSSATVYGDRNEPPYSEKSDTHPLSPYGRSKLMFEQVLEDWVEIDEKNCAVSLRYFNPVGAHDTGMIGESTKGDPNNLMPIIAQVATGEKSILSVFGNDYPTKDGTGERDFIHVMDLALGHVKAVKKVGDFKSYQAINLGSGQSTSVLEMVKIFENITGKTIPIEFTERRLGDVAKSVADPSKSKLLLNFNCKKSIEEMCADTWNWQSKSLMGN